MKNKIAVLLMLSLLLMGMLTLAVHVNPVASSPILKADYESAVIKVADRLVALQSPTDYGWDWIVTDLTSHSPNPSAANIYGVTALELLDAYKLTSNMSHFNAAKAVADYLVSLGSNKYHVQFDLEFLIEFAKISGDTTYKDFASAVWTWIKANQPEFADGVTLYNWYYTTRYPGSHGGTIWGTGDWAIAALELGDTIWATDMANVIADNYTKIVLGTDPYGFEYVGWGKALKAFQAVDPIAYADEIADIVSILTSLQQADGSFTGWVQDEAYVIMGLVSVGEIEMANKSAVWLIENQGYDTIEGGWKLPDGNEYSEVTSEAGQAIFRVIQAIGTVDLDHYSDGIVDVKTMTIGQALKAAYSGDTIVVHDGIYYENLIINKPLTLKSASFPIIDGGATGNCITVSANNVVVNGFEIRNGYNGIIGETDGSTFSNNIIHDNLNIPGYAGVGILLWGDNDNNIITGNTIFNNDRQGVFIGYSDTSKISTGNVISHNTVYNNGLYRYANGPDASAYGVQLWCADSNVIEHNEIYGHDDWFPYGGTFDFAQGLYLCASFNNIVRGNNLHNNNYGVGVWAAGRTPVGSNQINYNNIADNTGFGVRTFDTVANDARFNWWGDSSGPTHLSNPSGTGDAISNYIDYSPWLGDPFEITPRTYHVNPTGAPSAIQEAINEAIPSETIIVHEGTYNEQIVINKPLTIIGAGAATTIITGAGKTGGIPMVTIDTTGDVSFSGFTITDAPPDTTGESFGMVVKQSIPIPGVTYTISDCNFVGTNNPAASGEFQFYASGGQEAIVFTRNVITQYSGNALVSEVHTGPTEISHNVFDAPLSNVKPADVIFFMTYGGKDVITLQNISYNTFNMGTASLKSTAISICAPGPGGAQGNAKFTNVLINGNTFYDIENNGRAVGFWNGRVGYPAPPEGPQNNIISPVVTNNRIYGVPGSINSYGIFFYDDYGNTTGATIRCNTITGMAVGIFLRAGDAPGTIINYNNIYGNTIGVDWYLGSAAVDARYNWWGDPTGPYHPTLNPTGLGDEVSDNVNFEPWLLTEKVPPLVHDVAIIDVVPSATRIASGAPVQIDVTVKNEGNTYETFDVSLYYDSHLIGTQTVTDLVPSKSKILTFNWDTTGTTPGTDYTLTAIATTVPGETDTTDNTKSALNKVRVGKPALMKAPEFKATLLNQTVAINITVNDVEAYWRVIAVQFRLCYNSTLLEFINVTEGPFLKQYASQQPGSPGTFFVYFDEDHMVYGHSVVVGMIILPNGTGYWNPPFPEGNGTIATIYLKAIYQERGIEKPPSSCDLVLVETDIFDDDGETIPYTLQDGSYQIPPTHIGDFNYDGRVDMNDIYRCAKAFGEKPGRPRWDPVVDVNGDGRIDMADLYICCKAFGWQMGDP